MKTFFALIAASLGAAAAGWWLGAHHVHSTSLGHPPPSTRKVLYYQSTMHPWVKSDKPGKCTVCGMQLVPIYAGTTANSAAANVDIVLLPEGSPTVANIQTIAVARRPLVRTLRVAGIIDDDESRHRILSAYAAGRIEKLFVNFEGAEVQRGEPLATYYSKDLLNAVREYKVTHGQGPSPLLTAAEMRLEQLGMSKEQIARAPQRAESDVFVEILAPTSGTVVKRYVYEGQYVQEGEKLFEIADFSTMWFQFIAYEQDLPFLREGLPVSITTPSLPGRTFTSTIKFINPNLDGTTRSARVRVEITNPENERGLHQRHEILHKLYADATVSLDAPEVLAVPRDAVIWTGGTPRVYVEKARAGYQQCPIVLGRSGDKYWEVLEGLSAGELVVARGNMLIDGQAQLSNIDDPQAQEATPLLADPAMEMSADEHGALEKFLVAVADTSAALAGDDLGKYNALRAALPDPPREIAVKFPPPADDLATARREFLPLSQAVADYARRVRGHFPKLRIFRCPMSDQVGGGVPDNARWIQFSGDLQNPYMGKEMLHCGVEVK
jgi:Cu(I)/Ag(I) efflux system membrane fusion protein